MDLNYPSSKIKNFSNELNNIDRRFGSIILSNPRIYVQEKVIKGKFKKKCIHLIINDQPDQLVHFIRNNDICVYDQISKEGYGWTILHYIAKHNSSKCMAYCLRWLYQSQPTKYEQATNKKNCQDDTPLLVACTYKSNNIIKILLEYGGIDVYIINSKKLTAYQITLSSSNEDGLQMLMKYQLKIKKKGFINQKQLCLPLPAYKQHCFRRIWECIADYFTFHGQQQQKKSRVSKQTQTDRKSLKKQQRTSEYLQQIQDISIYWSEIQKVYGRKIPLFSTISNPLSIKQSSIIVSNLLIVFQVIAEYQELLKKTIYMTDNKFYVKMSYKYQQCLVTVDKSFPFLVQTNQPVFLSLQDQLWPMVLQKALCQYYNGFFQPAKVLVQDLLETITGCDVYEIDFTRQKKRNAQNYKHRIQQQLQKLSQSSRIILLKSAPQCPIRSQDGRQQCFSLLKIENNNFLINCPFILDPNHKKQHKQTMEMELYHAHYHSRDCTTVWMDQEEFFGSFLSAVFCHVLSSDFGCRQYKVTLNSSKLYLILKIEQHMQNGTIYLTLYSQKSNKNLQIKKCIGWNMRGINKQLIQKINCQVLGEIEIRYNQSPCQIIIVCDFDEGINGECKNSVVVRCRCVQDVGIDVVDQEIGNLEFVQCCKRYFNDNYENLSNTIIQSVGNYLLIMAASQSMCYVSFPQSLNQDNIIQGKFIKQDSKVQMLIYDNIYFAVLVNVSDDVAKNLQILGYESEVDICSDLTKGSSTK